MNIAKKSSRRYPTDCHTITYKYLKIVIELICSILETKKLSDNITTSWHMFEGNGPNNKKIANILLMVILLKMDKRQNKETNWLRRVWFLLAYRSYHTILPSKARAVSWLITCREKNVIVSKSIFLNFSPSSVTLHLDSRISWLKYDLLADILVKIHNYFSTNLCY